MTISATDMNVSYPIAIDSNLAIWRAFNNRYWPALFFVDAKGQIRGNSGKANMRSPK